ncbi:unnamed protein product [Callosobruchus maculatus]|uniref:Uncharacterized protein n=1 Tax=Callosobruchus maculatus TaxID=64391 RepID=A0A653DIN4_CALMS|nr:unnamed protein product [Callosobruchus maculatus]
MGFSCPKYKFVKYLELEQCDGTFALMGGLHISQKPTGDFYVKTNAEPEFALLQKNSVFER